MSTTQSNKNRRSVRRKITRRKSSLPHYPTRPKRKFNARKRKIFYKAMATRLPITRCCNLAGINHSTYNLWMKKGKEIRHPVQRRFRFKVHQIIAKNEKESLDIIKKAASGGAQVVETKVVVGPKGTETTRTWKTALPVWQAAAWYLERRHREDYSRDAMPEDKKKSIEEQAQEVKEAFDALKQTVPTNGLDMMPEDMPE